MVPSLAHDAGGGVRASAQTSAAASAQTSAPLVDASVDLKGFPGFILDVEMFLSSELIALAAPEEIAAALMLWCRAWQQVPHGSLPNDERVLAAFSRSKNWKKVRDMALRGFVLCSDGRLYHRTLCKKVQEAWAQRQAYAKRREKDAERLRDWRGRKGGRGSAVPAGIDFGAGIDLAAGAGTAGDAATADDTDDRAGAGGNAIETRFTATATPLRREERREEMGRVVMGREGMGREGNDAAPGGTAPPRTATTVFAQEAA